MPDQIKLKAVLLDCTLRDGGYYNDWDFSIDLVHSYLNAMQAISVDYVELGFRSLKNSGFKGAYAYTTDSHINSLSIPDGLKLGVMINAAEFIEYSDDPSAALNLMFTAAESSLVSLVRIAARYKELELALYLTHLLKEMGYTVAINLMQATEFSDGDLQQVSKQVSESRPDIFYVADSMGRLQPNEVKRLVQNLKTFWDGAIGIHAHDNLGGALSCTKDLAR